MAAPPNTASDASVDPAVGGLHVSGIPGAAASSNPVAEASDNSGPHLPGGAGVDGNRAEDPDAIGMSVGDPGPGPGQGPLGVGGASSFLRPDDTFASSLHIGGGTGLGGSPAASSSDGSTSSLGVPGATPGLGRRSGVSQYQNLLDQVTALQADLSKTFAVCQTLRTENESLSSNYYRLQEEYSQLRGKHADMRKRYFDEQKVRIDMESKHDQIVRTWKEQLDQKAQEFADAQAHMEPPRDLDLLRIKIQEELERPHQEKVRGLEGEVAKYRDMFYNIRREHELLRTEFEQYTIDQGKREQSLQESNAAVVGRLKATVSQLEQANDATNHADEVRRLRLQLKETEVCCESLRTEISDLRGEKERACIERDRAHLAVSKENTELLASVKTLEARAQNAETHSRSLQVQVDRLNRRITEHQKRIAAADHDLSAAHRDHEKKEQSLRDDVAAAEERGMHEAQRLNERIAEANDAREESLKQVRELQWELQSCRAKLDAHGEARDAALSKARKEAAAKAARVAEEKEALAERVRQAQQAAESSELEKQDLQQMLEQEREQKKTADQAAAREHQQLRQRITELERAVGSSQEQHQQSGQQHAELQTEYDKLRAAHRELRAREQALTAERESLEAAREQLEQEIATVAADHERDRDSHRQAVKSQEAAFHKELKAAQARLRAERTDATQRSNEAARLLRRARGKCERYKEQALKQHRTVRDLRQSLAKFAAERDAERQRLKTENDNLRTRLHEIERSRDVLLMGGSGGAEGAEAAAAADSASAGREAADGGSGVTPRRNELQQYVEKLRTLGA